MLKRTDQNEAQLLLRCAPSISTCLGIWPPLRGFEGLIADAWRPPPARRSWVARLGARMARAREGRRAHFAFVWLTPCWPRHSLFAAAGCTGEMKHHD